MQLSPVEFASYLGFSESLIIQIETPGEEIPVQVLLSLLEKMNVSTDWILTGRGNIFTQEGAFRLPQSPEDKHPEKHGFYLSEVELDQRIADLEQLIKEETHLPLEQIHALFRHLLNLDIAFLQQAPDPTGRQAQAQQPPFFEKMIYYQELLRQVNGARREFLHHFTRLVELTRDHKPLD